MKIRGRVLAALGATALAFAGVVPAHAAGPEIPDDLPRVAASEPEEFEASAEELPADYVEAIERDLGMSAEQYLAEAEAAVQGAEVIEALVEAEVSVNGAEMDGTELVVYVDEVDDILVVESTGATAVVGQQELPDLSHLQFEAADSIYSGSGWGYRVDASNYATCSAGFAGYSASGDDLVVTAGHCFGQSGSATSTTQYDNRLDDPRILNWTKPREYGGTFSPGGSIGTLVSGTKEFGNGYDSAILNTQATNSLARPQVLRWGSSGTGAGQGAPLASAALTVTGSSTGVAGMPICKSGARTGWTCGTIQAVDQAVDVSGHLVNTIRTTACVLPGDSGGALVTGSGVALGITSGSTGCSGSGQYSVFFPLLSPGGHESVAEKYGSDFTLCTGPVPFVTSPSPGGAPGAANPLTGKLPCALAGTTTQVGLYLNGSSTPAVSAVPSGTSGSWSLNLNSLAAGSYAYRVRAQWGSSLSPAASGCFVIGSPTLVANAGGGGRVAATTPLTGILPQFAPGTTLEVHFDGAGSPSASDSPSGSCGDWDFSLDGLSVGNHSYTVNAYDSGHSLIGSVGGSITITPPLPVVSGTPGGALPNPQPLKGSVQGFVSGMQVKVYIDGAATPAHTETETVAPGNWSYSTASLATGTHTYRVAVEWGGSPILEATGSFSLSNVGHLPTRIAGDDRYATAAAIAGVWDQTFDADIVFVATGANYPDALSAAAAAAHLGAPVVLTPKHELPSVVKARLNALHPDQIIVLGSSAAVSNSVFNALKTVSGSPQVVRWQGSDRYATGREIVKRAFGVNGNGDGAENRNLHTIVIATGRNFPDALSAGPAVASVGGAVILVDGSKSSIPAETMNLIRDLEPQNIVIAGSTSAVKAGIESQLRSAFGSGKVKRIAGANRYATSTAITDHFFDDADAVFFATGRKFPDALAGAALAGALDAPLLVTEKSCVSTGTRNLVNSLTPLKKTLLGSSASISNNVYNLKTC